MRQRTTAKRSQDPIRSGLQLGQRVRLFAFSVAAVASLAAHAGLVLAALDWPGPVDPGAIPDLSDAVSVELAATDTLEALKPERQSDPAPSPVATAPVAGTSTPAESSEKMERPEKHEPVEKAEPSVPDAEDAETRAADLGKPPDVPVAPMAPAAPAEPPTESPPDTPVIPDGALRAESEQRSDPGPRADAPKPPKAAVQGENAQAKPKKAKQAEKRVAQPEGGITSRARAGKGTGGARISASSGAMLTYKAAVQARINANRPSGGTPGSTAFVGFGLTTSGALAYARIVRSSGDANNDRIALAAVRGAAPFPPPPAGAQLQFTIPYNFR